MKKAGKPMKALKMTDDERLYVVKEAARVMKKATDKHSICHRDSHAGFK